LPVKIGTRLAAVFRRDPVFLTAGLAALASGFVVPPDSAYLAYFDFKVLICLLALMVAVDLLHQAQVFQVAAASLLTRTSGLRSLTFVLVGLTYGSAMFITNDVALIAFIPLTLTICRIIQDPVLMLRLVILQTVAANVGSMMTPIGNPQNLYLFLHPRAQMTLATFWSAVWPVGLAGAVLLAVLIVILPDRSIRVALPSVPLQKNRMLYLAVILFFVALVCVFGLISEWVLLLTVLLLVLPFRPSALIKIDWQLLLTFAFLFVLIGNISRLDWIRQMAAHVLAGPAQVVLAGALLSQAISNVPATILLAGFTDHWRELLRGVNAGGSGTLIASLASVIAWRLYTREVGEKNQKIHDLLVFTGYNVLFLIVMVAVALLAP
jgi:Na+/H+ antiporter NhaD/arsenite permease-like protein